MIKYGRRKVIAVEVLLAVKVPLIVEAEVLRTVEATVKSHPGTMVEKHLSKAAIMVSPTNSNNLQILLSIVHILFEKKLSEL